MTLPSLSFRAPPPGQISEVPTLSALCGMFLLGLFIQRAAPHAPPPQGWVLAVQRGAAVSAPSPWGSPQHPWEAEKHIITVQATGCAGRRPQGEGRQPPPPGGRRRLGAGRAGAAAHLGRRGVRPSRPCRCTARAPRRGRSYSRERSRTGHTGDPASQAGTYGASGGGGEDGHA